MRLTVAVCRLSKDELGDSNVEEQAVQSGAGAGPLPLGRSVAHPGLGEDAPGVAGVLAQLAPQLGYGRVHGLRSASLFSPN